MATSAMDLVHDRDLYQRTFAAMGTTVHVTITEMGLAASAAGGLDYAEDRVRGLERCLSRFLEDSELSQLNRLAGFPTVVSPQLFRFVAAAWYASVQTEGSFDPTIGGSLIELGYDRPFESMNPESSGQSPAPMRRRTDQTSDGGADSTRFDIDEECRTVLCSSGVALDLGGIAKGMTADLVSEELLDMGAAGCCVNVGGDLRVRGSGPDPQEGWNVELACPGSDEHRTIRLGAGAVCTSAVTERRWQTGSGFASHVIDPADGGTVDSDLLSISVVGARAAAAEVLATSALVDGFEAGTARVLAAGATGLAVTGSGEVVALPGFDEFEIR